MQRVLPSQSHPLFDTAATRRLEQAALQGLPAYTLMQRAGAAVAQLAQALAPHARTLWIACGAGNNGGDGLEAAVQLHQRGRPVAISWLGTPDSAPADARHAWERVHAAGIPVLAGPPGGLDAQDACIDALLGIGLNATRTAPPPVADDRLHTWWQFLRTTPALVLAVDMPSGLIAETGQFAPPFNAASHSSPGRGPRHTLSLLTLKPGLFTAQGRDAAGTVWLDGLGTSTADASACAWLGGQPAQERPPHASHKGSFGDVAIVGGEGLSRRGMGMTGAALLAARAALHAGAGRVLVALLDDGDMAIDMAQPECMFRRWDALDLPRLTVVCGCGGGEAVREVLPAVVAQAPRLILDADALNALAGDVHLQERVAARARHADGLTVLTPHPLEAARLLGTDTAHVQADRLAAARQLAERYGCIAVLKGSGSVVVAPGERPYINPTGNAHLATAGTGDVLAGLIGARLATSSHSTDAFRAVIRACWEHGSAADAWPDGQALTASALAQRLTR